MVLIIFLCSQYMESVKRIFDFIISYFLPFVPIGTLIVAIYAYKSWQKKIKGEYKFKMKVELAEDLGRIKYSIEKYENDSNSLFSEISESEKIEQVNKLILNYKDYDFSYGELRRITKDKRIWFIDVIDMLIDIDKDFIEYFKIIQTYWLHSQLGVDKLEAIENKEKRTMLFKKLIKNIDSAINNIMNNLYE